MRDCQGRNLKKKKKLRVEGQEEGFMADAQRESRFSKTPKHGNSPAHSRMIGVPDFLSAYVEDVVRIVDSKSFMAKFGEKELEGELDFLLDGAKGLMLKVDTYFLFLFCFCWYIKFGLLTWEF